MARVVVVRAPLAGRDRLNKVDYQSMIACGLTALTDRTDTVGALKSLLGGGTVGMKSNCLAGKQNSTSVDLATAFGDMLEDCGWLANQIVIWERTSRELERAGFSLNASARGRRCLGTDAHPAAYGNEFYSFGQVDSLVSAIITLELDHHVNMPVLKDHSIAGLSAGLKNMYGAIHNPNKYHGNNCNPYAAEVSALPPLRNKHSLTIIDAGQVQCDKGPGFAAECIYPYHGIIVASDPVAADRVGLTILERIRSERGLVPLEKAGRPVGYLAVAEQIGLGTADLSRIEIVVSAMTGSGGWEPGRIWP